MTAFSTTRQGGYSLGSYGEFNINRYCGDSEEAIRQNRALLCQVLGEAYWHFGHRLNSTKKRQTTTLLLRFLA